MKRKRKKLPGFTLVELVIVVAIFSGIAVGALAMVNPALQLYYKTVKQEQANAAVDNITRYIQDNLRYAYMVNIYKGYSLTTEEGKTNIDAFTENTALKPLDPNTTFVKTIKEVNNDKKKILQINKIYVMEITSEAEVNIAEYSYSVTKNMGTEVVNISKTGDETGNNREYYDKFRFSAHHKSDDAVKAGFFKVDLDVEYSDSMKIDSAINIALPNINDYVTGNYDLFKPAVDDYDNDSSIFIVYTVPEIIRI